MRNYTAQMRKDRWRSWAYRWMKNYTVQFTKCVNFVKEHCHTFKSCFFVESGMLRFFSCFEMLVAFCFANGLLSLVAIKKAS